MVAELARSQAFGYVGHVAGQAGHLQLKTSTCCLHVGVGTKWSPARLRHAMWAATGKWLPAVRLWRAPQEGNHEQLMQALHLRGNSCVPQQG